MQTSSVMQRTQPDTGVFDLNEDMLKRFQETLGKELQKKIENVSHHNNVISQQVRKLAITKFCKVCEHLNIDCTHPLAFSLVLLVMSKIPSPLDTARSFLSQMPDCTLHIPTYSNDTDSIDSASVESAQKHDEDIVRRCDDACNEMTEWLTLLEYVDVNSLTPLPEHKQLKMFKFLEKSAKEQTFALPHITVQQIPALIMLYRAPRHTQANLMIQRMAARKHTNDTKPTFELNCLRFVGSIGDHDISDNEQQQYYFKVLEQVRMQPSFFADLRATLSLNAEACKQHKTEQEIMFATRPRLADRVSTIRSKHVNSSVIYVQTIQNWANHIRFPVATSSQLQRILYFACVQRLATSADVYSKHYMPDVVSRAEQTKVQSIDIDAVMVVIRSLRVYRNNVTSLLDFHTSCLAGLPQRKRQDLSVVNVFQLYVAANQHDSIWKQCWTSLINVINHTIEASRDEFLKKHQYEVDRVVESAIECHIGESALEKKHNSA